MELLEDDDIKAFLVESYENLNAIERDILELEKSANQDSLVRIYRQLHSIKGNSGFLPFQKLESVAHTGENLLGYLRENKLAINTEITNALLETVDTIRQILSQIEAQGNEGDRDYSKLLETLNQLQQSQQEYPADQSPEAEPEEEKNFEPLVAAENSIRVDVELLDRVMNLVGELVLARNQIIQFSDILEDTAFASTCQRLNLITAQLQAGVMKTRMQPISTIWQKFPRVVRDLAIACNKQVQVEMEGAETELDKSIIEAIKDPLTHLVRNCIDHGIETTDVRTNGGKVPVGRLLLRAFHESGKVNIEISDDGGGINAELLKQKAQKIGFITATEAAKMSEKEAVNLIFLPGLSTAEKVTNLSGRGVGMDVVKTNIEKNDGTVEVYTQLGKGTTFKIKIPLTLAIIPALIVVGVTYRYAIPQASIQELIRLELEPEVSGIERLYDVPVLRLRGDILPLIYLNQELQIEETTINRETIYIVAIKVEDYRFGLVVDGIEDTQDIVVKPLGKQLKDVTVFAGATILGDGKVALIIDAIELANHAGMNAQMQKQLSNFDANNQAQEDNNQMVLLLHGPQGARMGIPLAIASRLEEFPRSAIEQVGNQFVVQYRDKILSLIDLNVVFSTNNNFPSKSSYMKEDEEDKIQVVVVSLNPETLVGLLVERIIDIVEEPLNIKGNSGRLGVAFLAVIQGQITEILDIETIVRIANPYLLELSRAT